MSKIRSESGRSLLETLALLVLMALLVLSGIVGYDFVVRKYREQKTVKQVSELGVRYKLRPVKTKGKFVQIKDVYPESDRVDAVTMRTSDTPAGRISLQVFDEVSSFAVVVNHVLDNSCRSILKDASYDMVVAGDDIDVDTATKLNAYSRDYLLNDPEGQEIAKKLCKSSDTHHMGTMGLVSGGNCPTIGASYWYGGKCWNCASNRAQDSHGNCCEKGQVDVCGYCPGKCPNGGVCNTTSKLCVECNSDAECAGRMDGRLKCNLSSHTCVQCTNVGQLCAGTGPGTGTVDKYCMKNHTCQECDTTKHMIWNSSLDICECVTPLIAFGQACFDGCCIDGTTCHEGVCIGCWEDYDPSEPNKKGACRSDKPLCQNGSCQPCSRVPSEEGETCSALCGCDATKGLTCVNGNCACAGNENRTTWLADKKLCCLSESNYEQACDAETGSLCCSTGFCSEPGADGTRLCCHEGEVNSNGHCCPLGQSWLEEAGIGQCCPTGSVLSSGQCCPSGLEWKPGSTPETGLCCTADEINVSGHCCAADKPFWDGHQCVECIQNTDCPENKVCSSDKVCIPCNTSGTGIRRLTDTVCSCPEGYRKRCGSQKTTINCVDGGSWTCVNGCFDNTDCPTDQKCSCSGDTCPSKGGKCGPCPEGTHRASDAATECIPCGECEEWDETSGICRPLCPEGQICLQVAGNKATPLMCGGEMCVVVPKKDQLVHFKGKINGYDFYIPPAQSKYQMTHTSASRFCQYYDMHLASVTEACVKDYKYNTGHDCPNISGNSSFKDDGTTYKLKQWHVSKSGSFWLANLSSNNNALRVTYSCGNNHESHVCNKFYPLCTKN